MTTIPMIAAIMNAAVFSWALSLMIFVGVVVGNLSVIVDNVSVVVDNVLVIFDNVSFIDDNVSVVLLPIS